MPWIEDLEKEKAKKEKTEKDEARDGRVYFCPENCNGCSCHLGNPPCSHCTNHFLGEGTIEYDDPTPYCSSCGAKRKKYCNCGPIPDND